MLVNDAPYVLSLCDRTGNMVKPWLEAGFRAVTVDLREAPHSEPGRLHIVADVRAFKLFSPKPAFAFAAPPCTDLAVSGARWFREKGLKSLSEALEIVDACRVICEDSDCAWALENPISTLSTYWRKPDHIFDPSDYASHAPHPELEAYTKKTCIWSGNDFVMPAKNPIPAALGSKMHRLPPSENRADLRSETPLGFAYAVKAANHA